MKSRMKKRSATLVVEELEKRCVPAYLTLSPGPFTVQGKSDQGVTLGSFFQLNASIVTTSLRYGVSLPNGNGLWQAVTSTPRPLAMGAPPTTPIAIRTPTPAEWALLNAGIADRSLLIFPVRERGPFVPSQNNLALK
jgi:hypothetical protein